MMSKNTSSACHTAYNATGLIGADWKCNAARWGFKLVHGRYRGG